MVQQFIKCYNPGHSTIIIYQHLSTIIRPFFLRSIPPPVKGARRWCSCPLPPPRSHGWRRGSRWPAGRRAACRRGTGCGRWSKVPGGLWRFFGRSLEMFFWDVGSVFWPFFWRCLEVFGKDLVIWCWFLWVYSGVDCEEKVWLKVGRFGRYSWVLPGMVAVFGGVQVLDFIVGDVVGERPITPCGS